MEDIVTLELQLISRLEKYYCTTCGEVFEAKTFLMVEMESGAIVAYVGTRNNEHFMCKECKKKRG